MRSSPRHSLAFLVQVQPCALQHLEVRQSSPLAEQTGSSFFSSEESTPQSQTGSSCSCHAFCTHFILGEQVWLQLDQWSFFLKQVMPCALQHLEVEQSFPLAEQTGSSFFSSEESTPQSQTGSSCSCQAFSTNFILGEQVRLQLDQWSFFLKQVMPVSLQHLEVEQSSPLAVQAGSFCSSSEESTPQSQTGSSCSCQAFSTHFILGEQVWLQLAQWSFFL